MNLLLFPAILTLVQSISIEEFEAPLSFPKDFIFSAATASYQVEGGWNASGKGENVWDRKVHTEPNFVKDNRNGDIACDSFNKYKEDVQLLKHIGFKMYRFSLSWTRIFPDGTNSYINQPGVQYYHDLIDELLKNDIQPMVTLHHWDVPQHLQEFGGWLNSSMVQYFEDFAFFAFSTYGEKVKWWITINEPLSLVMAYGSTDYAPALDLHGTGEYIAAHNMIKAHAKVYRLYQSKFKQQKGKISFASVGDHCFPKSQSNEDRLAAERSFQFQFGWFAHPIYIGDYPPIMRKIIDENSAKENLTESRLPRFSDSELDYIKGSFDYFALNHYTSKICTYGPNGRTPSWARDSNVTYSVDDKWPKSQSPWLRVVPTGFRKVLNRIKNEYGNPEIFITENGFSDYNTTEDTSRIFYYYKYMKQMELAMNEDKCRVIGYTVWSLLDNFEWRAGYTQRFGIVHIDFDNPDRPRTLKKSAIYFKQIIKSIVN